MEIEQKFIVNIPNDIDKYQHKDIIQGYLCVETVVRVRKSNDMYYLTYKNKKGDSKDVCICEEVELPLTKESFDHLLDKCDGSPIIKKRYVIPLDDSIVKVANLKVELDIFEGVLEGLVFAEVEFPDEESVDRFIWPDWFLENVSSDKRYRNNFLTSIKNRKEFLELFKLRK